tara:strand:+ start:338 stop:511 length:174 start_codon:yes stop_codon:yes gene_type:complete
MTPNKTPKAISLIGLALTLTGLTFKLNHLMGAPEIFNIGIAILVIGLSWWAIRLIRG